MIFFLNPTIFHIKPENILSKTSAFSIIKQFECEFKAHCIEFSIDKIYKSSYIKNMGTYTISQLHIRFQVWHK